MCVFDVFKVWGFGVVVLVGFVVVGRFVVFVLVVGAVCGVVIEILCVFVVGGGYVVCKNVMFGVCGGGVIEIVVGFGECVEVVLWGGVVFVVGWCVRVVCGGC